MHFSPHVGVKEMKRTVRFDSSCYYAFNDEDQYDINKLFGFSEGLHHQNSARFGWRCNPNKRSIEIHTYVYRDGVRVNVNGPLSLITEVPLNTTFYASIQCNKEFYIFRVVYGKFVSAMAIGRSDKAYKFGYYLYPYFGGNKTAPHDMVLEISK